MGERKARRPPGWSKETVLRLLDDPPLTRHLKRLAGPCGVKWRTLYNDIADWRKDDPEFGQAYADKMEDNPLSAPGVSGAPRKVTAQVFAAFIGHFKASGGKIRESCQRAGFGPDYLYQLTTPGFREYNPEFARAYEEAYQILLADAEDTFTEVIQSEEADDRTRVWAALKRLERRDRQRWGQRVEVGGEVRHRHDHQHELRPGERRGMISERLSRWLRGKPLELPGVVDGEAVEVE